MPFRTTRTGGYTPSEIHVDLIASNYTSAHGGQALIYCHGLGATSNFMGTAGIREDLSHHGYRGWVVCAPALGGGATWGNSAIAGSTVAIDGSDADGAIDGVLGYLATTYSADITKVLFIADSHGAPGALNWAVRNPAQFGAAVLRVPAFSLQTLHDTDPLGLFAAGMEAAYGGLAGLVAAYPTRDALHPTFIANLLTLNIVDRLRVMYNANDNIVDPAPQVAFGAATGVETIEMGGPDHAPWGLFDIMEQFQWLRSHV